MNAMADDRKEVAELGGKLSELALKSVVVVVASEMGFALVWALLLGKVDCRAKLAAEGIEETVGEP